MKSAVLLALMLAGCVTQEEGDMARAREMCQQSAATNQKADYPFSQCVADNYRNLRILSSYTPPASTPVAAPSIYPQQAQVPTSDAPVLQNIIPPTTRCQSVASGLGTVQTICR